MASDPRRTAVVLTGLSVVSAFGRGLSRLRDGVLGGEPAFGPVTRFDVGRYRARVAATLPESPVLHDELVGVLDEACAQAGLDPAERATSPLLLATHADPALVRSPAAPAEALDPAASVAALAARCGLARGVRTYTAACVAASTALADAAAMIQTGRALRVVVAAGYLVDEDYFALFDSGRALADDGALRPFSAGRRGLLLGDGVAAAVLEAEPEAGRRGVAPLGRLAGWGRSGDAHHVCRPHPRGEGLARAIDAALARAGVGPDEIGYVNAHGTGTSFNDTAEAAALRRSLGSHAGSVPVSSTKSLHGHALEASGLLELAVTVVALHARTLPVNAGYLGPDGLCPLNLVLDNGRREADVRHALSLNAAFGGANTALVVAAA